MSRGELALLWVQLGVWVIVMVALVWCMVSTRESRREMHRRGGRRCGWGRCRWADGRLIGPLTMAETCERCGWHRTFNGALGEQRVHPPHAITREDRGRSVR